ncbi:MAG: serine/threonine protein kinase [Deltaproteobacteria bacterium]|nr:serine/threonine protein kinase [Deltaproteobacteria bacterium]
MGDVGDRRMDKGARTGQVLGGNYRLGRLIGEGGMGSVYEADHVRLPKRFAIKLLNPQVLGNREVFERFQREAMIASELGDQHIVQVFDFNYTTEGAPFMVLELLTGDDLARRLESGRLTLGATCDLLKQLAKALGAAHARGIVHRDLKPANLFLARQKDGTQVVKVLDFGISKVLEAGGGATRTGALLGTPSYMAPEQAQGNVSEIDVRTDVFAVGAILYECLTGQIAFQAPTVAGIVYQVCHVTPVSIESLVSDIPAAVVEVVNRALAKGRTERYQSMRALTDDFVLAAGSQGSPGVGRVALERASGATVRSPTTIGASIGEVARPPAHSLRWRASLVALAIAIAGAVAVVLFVRGRTRHPRANLPEGGRALVGLGTDVEVASPADPLVEWDSVMIETDPAGAYLELVDAGAGDPGVLLAGRVLLLQRGKRARVSVSAVGYDSQEIGVEGSGSRRRLVTLRGVDVPPKVTVPGDRGGAPRPRSVPKAPGPRHGVPAIQTVPTPTKPEVSPPELKRESPPNVVPVAPVPSRKPFKGTLG